MGEIARHCSQMTRSEQWPIQTIRATWTDCASCLIGWRPFNLVGNACLKSSSVNGSTAIPRRGKPSKKKSTACPNGRSQTDPLPLLLEEVYRAPAPCEVGGPINIERR